MPNLETAEFTVKGELNNESPQTQVKITKWVGEDQVLLGYFLCKNSTNVFPVKINLSANLQISKTFSHEFV